MSFGSKQVHIVSTDFDYATESPEFDRISHIFDDHAHSASKVYVLTNTNVQGTDDDLEKAALEGVEETLKEVTSAADKDGIKPVEVDYYDFESSLTTIYELIYREQQKDNNIFVNLSGGTKPLAIAMSFACALSGLEQSPFYIIKEYAEREGEIRSTGLSSMDILELDVFDLEESIPSDEKEQNFLHYLFQTENDPIGVTDLLVEVDEIAPSPSEGDGNRQSIMQSYNRKSDNLEDNNYVEKKDGEYTLTSTGRLMAKIIEIKREVEDAN